MSKKYLDVFEPATGEAYSKVPDSNADDITTAFQSAKDAFPDWSGLPIKVRSEYLNNIADLLESRQSDFAHYESKDTGKPVSLAETVDIPRAIDNFRFFAESVSYTHLRAHET